MKSLQYSAKLTQRMSKEKHVVKVLKNKIVLMNCLCQHTTSYASYTILLSLLRFITKLTVNCDIFTF